MKTSTSGNDIVRQQINNDYRNYRFDDFAKVSRNRAREIGQRVYFGNSCHKKHAPWRYTSNKSCVQCQRTQTDKRDVQSSVSKGCKMLDIDAKREEMALKRQLREFEL